MPTIPKRKNKKRDWVSIQHEYVTGQLSLRGLAEKHQVQLSVIGARAASEDWTAKREQFRDALRTAAAERTVEEAAETLAEERKRMVKFIDAVLAKGLEQLMGRTEADPATGEVHLVVNPVTRVRAIDILNAAKLKLVLLGETVDRVENVAKDEHELDNAIESLVGELVERRLAKSKPSPETENSPSPTESVGQ